MKTILFLIFVAILPLASARFATKFVNLFGQANVKNEFNTEQLNSCLNSTFPCSGHGTCMPNGECVCFDGYTDYNSKDDCNYERKSAFAPFLFEIFLGGFGAGWFYIGNIAMGVGQLVYFIPGACIIACVLVTLGVSKDELNGPGAICGCSLGCGWFMGLLVFYIWSLVIIATGQISDENGISYKSL